MNWFKLNFQRHQINCMSTANRLNNATSLLTFLKGDNSTANQEKYNPTDKLLAGQI